MNRKGVLIVESMFMFLFISAFVAAGVTRPMHIEKRYMQRCQKDGSSLEQCKINAAALSLDQKVEYIRDTVENPDIPNTEYLASLPNFERQ